MHRILQIIAEGLAALAASSVALPPPGGRLMLPPLQSRKLAAQVAKIYARQSVDEQWREIDRLANLDISTAVADVTAKIRANAAQKQAIAAIISAVPAMAARQIRACATANRMGLKRIASPLYADLIPLRRPRLKINDTLGQASQPVVATQLIGLGGFGEIWQARIAKQIVALKVGDNEWHRLREEGAVLTRLANCHSRRIVALHSFDFDADIPWIATEYMPGGDLAAMLQICNGAIPRPIALQIVWNVGEGIVAAHRLGIVHRDLKPANILFDGNANPRVADFGLGEILNPASADPVDISGEVSAIAAGTRDYMAPEQQAGMRADPSDDVYSLGVLLFRMLVGDSRIPPRYVREKLSAVSPVIAEPLIRLVEACIDKPRGQRPSNAMEMLALFDQATPIAKIGTAASSRTEIEYDLAMAGVGQIAKTGNAASSLIEAQQTRKNNSAFMAALSVLGWWLRRAILIAIAIAAIYGVTIGVYENMRSRAIVKWSHEARPATLAHAEKLLVEVEANAQFFAHPPELLAVIEQLQGIIADGRIRGAAEFSAIAAEARQAAPNSEQSAALNQRFTEATTIYGNIIPNERETARLAITRLTRHVEVAQKIDRAARAEASQAAPIVAQLAQMVSAAEYSEWHRELEEAQSTLAKRVAEYERREQERIAEVARQRRASFVRQRIELASRIVEPQAAPIIAELTQMISAAEYSEWHQELEEARSALAKRVAEYERREQERIAEAERQQRIRFATQYAHRVYQWAFVAHAIAPRQTLAELEKFYAAYPEAEHPELAALTDQLRADVAKMPIPGDPETVRAVEQARQSAARRAGISLTLPEPE